MESLSETDWDVIISGTGLQQSLLALSLSRTKKNILHVDPNEYYGGAEAALSLQDADEWVSKCATASAELNDDAPPPIFSNTHVSKADEGLSASRSYSIALAPQVIHARSELLNQLVSSKAFRQIEFLAVGSFYIYTPSTSDSAAPSLSRIPSTREDVFTNTTIPAKSKRALMKFLKFVLDYEEDSQKEVWKPKAAEPLTEFLVSQFKLDPQLQASIVAMTLSLDGKVTVEEGLKAITRHLSSMGKFGAFAAVYPKWGGLSEVAQVGCRAGAVGGATYMLGSSVVSCKKTDGSRLEIELSDGTTVKGRSVVKGSETSARSDIRISRLTAIVSAEYPSILQPANEGSPTPAVALVAFPPGTVSLEDGFSTEYPVYAGVHSSDTGECPTGQTIIYLSTVHAASSKSLLDKSLSLLLTALSGSETSPTILYELSYDQAGSTTQSLSVEDQVTTFPSPSVELALDDDVLNPVKEAWKLVAKLDAKLDGAELDENEYMQFEDREGVDDDDEDM